MKKSIRSFLILVVFWHVCTGSLFAQRALRSNPAGGNEIQARGALTTYRMDFEQIADFSLNFDPWRVRDVDSNNTFGITLHTFPHSGSPMAFIAFNPANVTPTMTDQGIQPHGGQRFGACFSAMTPPNNDWFISPKIKLGTGGSFAFWVKSYTGLYGLEKYKVAVSTTTNNPASFTFISGTSPLLADTAWTKKSFDLSPYNNDSVYVAIQCVSDTSFIFMIDDLEVSTDTTTPLNADFTASQTTIQKGDSINFSDHSTGYPIAWQWSFPGGNPSSSDLKNPVAIKYETPGTYGVTLVITKGTDKDTITKFNYITVKAGEFPTYLSQDFEGLSDFSTDFYPWTVNDVNGGITYGIANCTFPNNGSPMAFINFNPSQAVPPPANMSAHTGSKFGACFSSQPPWNPNNKWLISPKMQAGDNPQIALWVESYNIQYGYERFKIGVSATGNDPADFTIISGLAADSATIDWTRRKYSFPAFANKEIYVGIQCVTNNGFCFMVDDIEIGNSLGTGDHGAEAGFYLYPNPAKDMLHITTGKGWSDGMILEICNLPGRVVKTCRINKTNSLTFAIDISGLEPGMYLVRISDNNGTATKKIIVTK